MPQYSPPGWLPTERLETLEGTYSYEIWEHQLPATPVITEYTINILNSSSIQMSAQAALDGDVIDPPPPTPSELVFGRVIPVVDQDVYDNFDPGWHSRPRAVEPELGTYFDGFCFDRDDLLGFFLHPAPAFEGHDVIVTYGAVPPVLVDNDTELALSDMYIDALCNYVIYRAAYSQQPGYSKVAAERAMERLGQQLNLSRETILAMIGVPHREQEQTS